MELKKLIEDIKIDGAYAFGDPRTFLVNFGGSDDEAREEFALPGCSDPVKYLRDLEITPEMVKGRDVCVICPGNGGLVAELAHMGAKLVIYYEPRYLYIDAIRRTVSILSGLKSGVRIGGTGRWPKPMDFEEFSFDLIFWPEGAREVEDPIAVFSTIFSMLRADGLFIGEIQEGVSDVGHRCFIPSSDKFLKFLQGIAPDLTVTRSDEAARDETARYYRAQNTLVVLTE